MIKYLAKLEHLFCPKLGAQTPRELSNSKIFRIAGGLAVLESSIIK